MNYIKQLTHFFYIAATDEKLSPTHISLFIALFQHWNQARFKDQIQIIRDDIMLLAKINSKATYHRSMAYLHQGKYINYMPSYNPYKGSIIEFFPEMTTTNKSQLQAKIEPVQIVNTRLINEPFNKLYNTNIINHNMSSARYQKEEKNKNQKIVRLKDKKEKSSAKKEKEIPPTNSNVEEFFMASKSTLLEANKFINYYTANGWLIGGRTPMKDWKAAARNWISNITNFNNSPTKNTRAQQLNINNTKNYFEPL